MLKTVVAIPTYVSVSAELMQQWFQVAAWCGLNNVEIKTVANRTHNDARNWLVTGGGGFKNPRQLIDNCYQIVFIDSDQLFTIEQLKDLIEHKNDFVSGWYLNGETPMIARWDEKHFLDNGYMEFLSVKEIEESKDDIEVDYCGFGFTKIKSSVLRQMEYPFFTNKQMKIGKFTENCSEDVSFCLDCPVNPVIIPSMRVGHLKEAVI